MRTRHSYGWYVRHAHNITSSMTGCISARTMQGQHSWPMMAQTSRSRILRIWEFPLSAPKQNPSCSGCLALGHTNLARPKFKIFAWPLPGIKSWAGLMSRCRIPFAVRHPGRRQFLFPSPRLAPTGEACRRCGWLISTRSDSTATAIVPLPAPVAILHER